MNKFDLIKKLKSFVDSTYPVLKVVESFDDWSIKEKSEFINESFFELIKYSFDNIPYYHKTLVEYGFSTHFFTDINKIKQLPILTKEIIRNNYHELKSKKLDSKSFQIRRSGGTTGEPIKSYISKNAAAYETFIYFKGLRWMGWNPKMTLVKLFGGSLNLSPKLTFRQKIYKYATNSIAIPAFEISNETVIISYEILKFENSICMIGYASAINNFVSHLKKLNLPLSNVNLVITTSELLTKDWELNIKDFFNCEVRSYYGCGEVGSLGYQINGKDSKYKIPTEHVFLENELNTNHILVSQLHNTAQPLIRYQLGDNGIIKNLNNESYIETLIGRQADYFFRSNGEPISPIFGTYSIQKSGIRVEKYQYIQFPNGTIEFRYQMESGILTDRDRKIIKDIVDYVMQEPTETLFIETNDFLVGNSGKHRICVRFDH